MDNTSILYNAIQRTYRNAIVELIRSRFSAKYGAGGPGEIRKLFAKKDVETGKTYWETIESAARERRSGGTGELSTPIRDEYELLGVEHFFNVFDAHFDFLCPTHAQKPKQERNQARTVLTTWMKQIKNVRDPVSHPVTDDIDYDESAHVLYCARKTLDFCGLAQPASQILRLQSTLLGGYSSDVDKILAVMPPADEVVMDFVGRHDELGALNDWLSGRTTNRWALSGEGGKGKSAIAYVFARNVATRDDHGLDAVLWMSAKRRRFVEGKTILVDRPDFNDKDSAAAAIIRSFGETPSEVGNENEFRALDLLTAFPSLLVADDLDTLEAEGEAAIQFLVMTVPERTKSRVLITSRRAVFGMANLTTQITGLSERDAEAFIKSRCDLMGVAADPILELKDAILRVTDATPLFVEDLLRLIQSGLDVEHAIGLWAEKRGTEARKYAMQREYDQLTDDAKDVLLALSLQGPCRGDDLRRGLSWSEERLVDGLQQLRKMFLMPTVDRSCGAGLLALNHNIRVLVLEVFRNTQAYRRTERSMKAAMGELKTKRSEDNEVESRLRRARLLVNQGRTTDAEVEVQRLSAEYPARGDIYGTLAWVNKKAGEFASARLNFRRAHELGCKDRDTYWHWSEMEAATEEWMASSSAAELGVAKFPGDQGLLFRHGYALHRLGKELIIEEDSLEGVKLCRKAQTILNEALATRTSEERNFSLRNQIYRAIALNLESLDEGAALARCIADWQKELPGDPIGDTEYQRLRQKYPQYLRAH